jgi:hypothetical protein
LASSWASRRGVAVPEGQDDADARARSQILALENIRNQAVTQPDGKALAEIFDDAHVYVEAEGLLMTKADFLARTEKARLQHVVTESMTAQIFGTTGIVTGTYRSTEMLEGKAVQRRGRLINAWVYKAPGGVSRLKTRRSCVENR